MSLRLLVIQGSPDSTSISNTLARTYGLAAQAHGADVRYLCLDRLELSPLAAAAGAESRSEADLAAIHDTIVWADHLLWAYPLAWGTMPKLLQDFVGRVFTPGFAYHGRPGSRQWIPLLAGKSADIIVVVDSLPWYNRFGVTRAATRALRETVLVPSGIGPVRCHTFGPVRTATSARQINWLTQMVELGTSGLGLPRGPRGSEAALPDFRVLRAPASGNPWTVISDDTSPRVEEENVVPMEPPPRAKTGG